MTIQITIIGLGQIGTSIGLCLSGDKNFRRVGHDRELEFARTAEKMGALDKVDLNLPHSVRDADIVILSIPVDQIQETLEYITQDPPSWGSRIGHSSGKGISYELDQPAPAC